MKQHTTIAIVGMVGGFLFSLLSAIRYYVIYTDLDRLIAYCVMGGLIMAVSWLYERSSSQQNTLDAIEDYISDKNEY